MYCGGLGSVSTSPNRNSTSNSTAPASSRRLVRRAVASSNILLTVYGNPDAGANPQPPPAPAMGDPSGVTVTVIATATATLMTTITSTMTYTAVCPTNPASLVVVEYCTTFTVPDCGCATQTRPAIPVTTVVHSCDACGAAGESSVTLTVPAAVVAAAAGATNAATAAPQTNAATAAAQTNAATVAAQTTAAANVSTTTTSAPGTVVTAAAGIAAMSKELLAMMVAGTCALYFAMLL